MHPPYMHAPAHSQRACICGGLTVYCIRTLIDYQDLVRTTMFSDYREDGGDYKEVTVLKHQLTGCFQAV